MPRRIRPIAFAVFAVTLTAFIACFSCGTATAGLLAAWEFDAGDVSGSSVSATAGLAANTTGTLQADAAITGGALDLDGSGDYLQFGNNLTGLRGLSNMTLSAWVKPADSSTAQRRIVEHEDNIYFWSQSGVYRYTNHGQTSQALSTTAPAPGTWQHVLVTYSDGAPGRIYVNGVPEGASGVWSAMADNTHTFQIGARRNSSSSTAESFWNGQIDDVAMWDDILTSDQIAALAGGGVYSSRTTPTAVPSGATLVGRWSMDNIDISGTTYFDSVGPFDGTGVNGGPTPGAAGQFDQAVDFAGGANNANAPFIDYSAYAPLLDNQGEATITAWIKPSVSGLQTNVLTIFAGSDKDDGSSEARLFVSNDAPTAGFGLGNLVYGVRNDGATIGNVATSGVNLLDDQWHFIALSVDANDNVALYIDGQALGFGVAPFLDGVADVDTIALGRNKDTAGGGGQWFYDGLMDEVRLYDKAMTQAEIQAVMNVPEPAGWLLALGAMAAVLLRRRQA